MTPSQRAGLIFVAGAIVGAAVSWSIAAGTADASRNAEAIREASRAIQASQAQTAEPEGAWSLKTFRVGNAPAITADLGATAGNGQMSVTCERGAYTIDLNWPEAHEVEGYFPRTTPMSFDIDGDKDAAFPFFQPTPYQFQLQGPRAHHLVEQLNSGSHTMRLKAEMGEEIAFSLVGFGKVAREFFDHCKPIGLTPFRQTDRVVASLN